MEVVWNGPSCKANSGSGVLTTSGSLPDTAGLTAGKAYELTAELTRRWRKRRPFGAAEISIERPSCSAVFCQTAFQDIAIEWDARRHPISWTLLELYNAKFLKFMKCPAYV